MSAGASVDHVSPPAVVLRRMRWWDVAEVAELDSRLFGRDAWSPAFFWSQLAAPGAHFVVAAQGADILGFVGVSVSGPQADVMTIGTAPRAQGQGIGRRLLTHAADHARARSAEALYLDVAEGNAAALGLYASAGFAEIGRRRGYYAEADAILMRAFL
ncbi:MULTISPECIES: ribosomal protein S18-alanine N-acetyltransferase [Brevibacterium]|jgi:ribosomal-protein-alanine N-acetyltransferase|uniref:Ribosomal protein S18-alanine N-acetyltransferase n=1 Tax=Brevibacterium salitolerans TaxID=1403566 RepID=A0ABN2X5B8_9MICO|nr:ribosomal protein S18-alanine N-acetyltransferase [Brevibacterium sp.]